MDSGSTDGTLDVAERYCTRLIQIRPQDFTFGRALNIGSAAAKGELLVNLSADAVPTDGAYLRRLTAGFHDSRVAATFGRDVPRPGTCPSQARDIEEWFPNREVERGHFFSNANAALRRSMWERFPFDEDLSGAEDAHWAKRVLAAGYRILYVPAATAYHTHSAWPQVVYRRAVRETKALKIIEPSRAQVDLWRAFRFWLGISALDTKFTLQRRMNPLWCLHIPFYRAAQAWGLYMGSRSQ